MCVETKKGQVKTCPCEGVVCTILSKSKLLFIGVTQVRLVYSFTRPT